MSSIGFCIHFAYHAILRYVRHHISPINLFLMSKATREKSISENRKTWTS